MLLLNNMKMKFKNAQYEDLEAINQLLRLSKGYWGYDKNFMDCFMQLFNINPEYLNNNITKLLYVDEKLAGFYSFVDNDDQFELDCFFLHPNFIGKGLGLTMWLDCCKTAKEQRKLEFIIWSDPGAESFYQKRGCVKIGTRQSPLMSDRHLPLLKYQLSEKG